MHSVGARNARPHFRNDILEANQFFFGEGGVFIRHRQMGRNAVQVQLGNARDLFQLRHRITLPAAHTTHPRIDSEVDARRVAFEGACFLPTRHCSDESVLVDRPPLL